MTENHLPCNIVDERLPLFVGGDLDPEALEAVRTHLAGCPPCREREARAVGAREAYRGALVQEASPDLWPGVRAALERDRLLETETPAPLAPVLRGPGFRRVRRIAAAAAILLVAGLLVTRPWGGPFGALGDGAGDGGATSNIVSGETGMTVAIEDPAPGTDSALDPQLGTPDGPGIGPGGLEPLAPGELLRDRLPVTGTDPRHAVVSGTHR